MGVFSARRLGFATSVLGCCWLAPVAAQTTDTALARELEAWYGGAARSAPGEWGVAIADQSGNLLWSVNAGRELVPASTVKLFTTGFARSVLGGTARRPTRVVGAGHVDPKSGEWIGKWALELNGDFTLERGDGAGPTLYDLALQLASGGVRKLTGPLTVESSDGPANAIYPAVWSQRHYGRLFAPLVGPLTLHENVVWFTVAPGARNGRRARLIGASPEGINSLVTVQATTVRGRRSALGVRPRKGGGWIVTGRIGVRAGSRRLSAVASDPKLVLDAAWGAALKRAGIKWNRSPYIGAPVSSEPRVLAEVSSPPLDSLASEVNRRSLNIGAELLLQWAGGRERGPLQLAAHVREVTGFSDGIRLVDGSGLSYDDRVTPAAFVAYLAKFPTTPGGRNFPQLLPANGTGTLRRLGTGLPGEGVVRAKTGTLGQVSTVVGYLGRQNGVLLVSLMYNGTRPWAARQAQWQLFRRLGADGVVITADSLDGPPPPQFGGDEEQATAPGWWPSGDGEPAAADDAAASE